LSEGLTEEEIDEVMAEDHDMEKVAEAWERLVLDVVEGEVSIRKF
jgi:hypothetical protein